MPAGATALEFKLTVTGRGGARYADTDSVTVRLPATVVTLAGPMHDLLPAGATAIVGNGLRLIYSYSADDLRGRVLTGSIEVAASIDGAAITHDIRIDGVRGEITVVLRRQAYPDPGEHELAMTLSAAAEGFVLAEPSSIATPFSFLPLPPTALEVRQAEGNQGKRGAVGSEAIELGYIFDYAAGNRLKRPRAGLSVQVDVELCADAGGGCVILAAASQALVLDGNGSLTLRVDRTAAALSVFGEADDDSIRHGRVLLRTAGDADFAAAAATTTFSFAVAAAVVTLSGPEPINTTGITGNEMTLVYSYSADDLHGRVLTGSIEVAAAIDGEVITHDIRIDGAKGEITVVLRRQEYPDAGEHELAVTLGAAAEGFVLAEPSSIATPFSFLPLPPTALEVRQAEGNQGKRGAVGSDAIELGYIFDYAAGNRLKRPRAGLSVQVDVELCADAGGGCVSLAAASQALVLDGNGSLTLRVDRTAAALSVFGEADDDSIRHGRVLLSTAGDADFAAAAATTTFSFAVAAAVVTLSGPEPINTTGITGNEMTLVYSYSADDLRGRVLTGSIEVAASIDGAAITHDIRIDGVRGEITVVLRRQAYPDPGEHELAVTLSAAAEGFVLAEPSSIATPFSFLPLPPTALEVRQAEGNQGKRGAVGSEAIELGYIFDYAAGNRLKRPRAGLVVQVDVELCVDAGGGCVSLAAASQTLALDGNGSLTLRVDRTAAALGVFGEADDDSIRHGRVLLSTVGDDDFAATSATTTFSFVVAAVVVTLSGPEPVAATDIVGGELRLVYSYSADDLHGRVLTGSIEVAAAIDGEVITPDIRIHGAIGEITIILSRAEYPDADGHQLAVTLSLSATATGFVLGDPSSITTPFSFASVAVADAVVTLSGPDLVVTTDIVGGKLSLVYGYSADDLHGRVLTGSIEVAAAIDGVAVTPAVDVDEVQGRGKITVVLLRRAYPYPGEHELAVTLSLSTTATGFVLGGTSSITTPFSFGAPAVIDTVVPVCGRTEQVRDAIVAEVDGVSDCADVTEADLAGITQLFIEDESIGALQVGDFSGLAALNGLVLNNISLTELPPKIFGGLAGLRALYLTGNELAALPLGVFGGLTALDSLYLNANSLTALATGVFTGLTELKTLDLSGNSLMALTASVFAGLAKLKTLHLNDNSLTTLPAGTFASLTALQMLNLNNNNLETLTAGAFAGLAKLETLELNGNNLTALPAGAFAGLTKLKVLFLNDNNLAELPSDVFTGLLLLQSLNLRDNDLAELPASIFDGLAALRTLQLNNNNLAALPAGVFDEPYRLQFLYLESNRLTALPAGIFSGTRKLVGLHLHGNPGSEDFLPIASAGADQAVEAGQIATLTATVSDTDPWGDNVSYAWTQTGNRGIVVALMDADTARPSFVMPAGATALEFELTVTGLGGAGFADTDSVTVRLPATVVTLAGPVHDLPPAGATAIVGDGLRLIYSYSADDLRGRVLTGSIEVAASIDGAAITYDIRIDGVRGEITVVLRRQEYPDPGEHELAVTLSAAAEGFVLADPSSIATPFSFLPLPPTALEVRQAEGNQGKRGAAGSDAIELGYIFDYAAGNHLKRPRAGLVVQVDVELCVDAGGGCVSLAAASQALALDGNGSLTLRVDRTAAALGVFGEADDDSIRHGRVLLSTVGDDDFAATSATTTFSFVVAAVVVTLSGPEPINTTGITGNEMTLVYSYSADDLHGRVLTGSIEVAAAIDGEVITPDIRIHGAIGEITIILSRAEYPEPGEHRLAVTLSLSATATGFVLGDPSSITTPFSFASVAVPDAVVTLSGPEPVAATDIVGGELRLVYSYSADDLHGRVLTGSIEVAAAIDGEVITPDIRIHGAIGEITIILSRAEYPEPGEHRLAVTLSLSATATGFVLGDPSSITTPFSFASVAVPDAVVTLSGPDLVVTTDIVGGKLSLVYGYSADDLHGRVLTGSIEVAAAIDGEVITPDIRIHGARGEITVVLRRQEYPDAGGHQLAVTLSLSATATGFALGDPSSITTPFSFASVAVPDTVVTLSGPEPVAATYIVGGELRLVYSYSADDLHGRVLTGSIKVAAAIDGAAITPDIRIHGAIGEITIILSRAEYPEPGEHRLAVTLSLSATATGFVLGDPSLITTPFSFALISTAIAEDGTCQLGMLGPGESCLYRGSSHTMRVLEARTGPRVFFFGFSEVGKPLNLQDVSNPMDPFDFNVYNLEAIMEGRGYRIIRIYNAPAYSSGKLSGSLDGATLLLAVLLFFANLSLAWRPAGGSFGGGRAVEASVRESCCIL